jgi:hypothetical protein
VSRLPTAVFRAFDDAGGRVYDTAGPVLVSALVFGLGGAGWDLAGLLFPGLAAALAGAAHWGGQQPLMVTGERPRLWRRAR